MLRLAVALTLVAVCFAQTPTRPKISDTFTSKGGFEFHDNRGTFFGEFNISRDQTMNMGVENATYKVGSAMEHYENLERFDMEERYTIRYNGSGDMHCQLEKLTGNLPEYWQWIATANYIGKEEVHEVEYDAWQLKTGASEQTLLVPQTDPNTPRFYRQRAGPIIIGYDFTSFQVAKPPSDDFVVPKACTTPSRRINRIPFYSLKPSI